MAIKMLRVAAHVIFRGRRFHYKHLRRFSRDVHHKKILEIGSGKAVRGEFIYSAEKCFDESNIFIKSDIREEYGHRKIDVTKLAAVEEFDVVLCLNVLEHVYEFEKALARIYGALKPDGTAIISVPGFYPLHDEPFDYWRFTEHALRRFTDRYHSVEIHNSGLRRYPFAYFVRARK